MPEYVVGSGARQTARLQRIFHEFRSEPVTSKRLGGAATGTAGDRNIMLLPPNGPNQPGLAAEWHVKGTQTILTPSLGTNGLNLGMDQTDNDGIEVLPGGITARSPLAFVVGTDRAFFFEVKAQIEDVSGADPFLIGFRKAEASQADWNDYAEAAYLGIVAGDIKSSTILTGAATVDTDTTDNAADATPLTFRVNVSGAGVVTYLVNAAAPTTVAAYTFPNGTVVVPSIYFLHGSDVAGTVELVHLDVGRQ